MAVSGSGCGSEPPEHAKPSVVLIVLDTARADRFSYRGWKRPTTPHVDRFARDAVDFRNAHSVASWTLPSHMSMFTGMLPGEHGATWAALSEPADMSLAQILQRSLALEDSGRLLARRLQAAGYRTIGVSHNPWISPLHGFGPGFEGLHSSWSLRIPGAFRRFYASVPAAWKERPELDSGDAAKTYLLLRSRFAADEVEEPFFAFVNFSDAHYPYEPPQPFVSALEGEEAPGAGSPRSLQPPELLLLADGTFADVAQLDLLYDAELRYVDHMLGRLFDWLRDAGLYDRSLIVLTSDHGEHLGEGGRFSHQLSVEEELLRVPLLIKFPGNAGAGTVETDPRVSNLDVYRTILAAAGAWPDGEEGLSQDLARMDAFDRESLLAEHYFSEAYLRQIRRLSPAFDVDAHRIVRRAVYAGDRKYVFHGGTLIAVEGGAAEGPDSEAVARLVRGHIERTDPAGLVRGEEQPSAGWLEQLEALGYVLGDGESGEAPPGPP